MTETFNIQTSPIDIGITLVEAGAGTGKTYALTRTVLRLVLEGTPATGAGRAGSLTPVEIPNILVVTFTRAATAELVTRIRRLISDAERAFAGGETDDELILHLKAKDDGNGLARLRQALRQCDDLAVCTIHSFCQRVLTSSAFESGMPFQTENVEEDDSLYIEQAAVDFWRDRVAADELLAALSVSEKWKRDDLVDHFKKWRRHPNTEILPESRPVEDALTDLREVLSDVLEAFDVETLTAFSSQTTWNKDAPLEPDAVAEVIEGFGALGRGDLINGLETALKCTTAAVHGKMRKTGKQKEPPSFSLFEACDRFIKAIEDVFLSVSREFIDQVGHRFDQEKRKRHILAFDDMLRRLDDALNQPADDTQADQLREAIGKQYEVALIDEFQDTDPFQYAIFRTAFKDRPLFLIGDPKQAIYRFRGADIFTYLQARREAGEPYSLTRNWRSESGLVEAVNRVFNRLDDPFVHPEIAFEDAVSAGMADEKPLTGDDGRPFHWWVLSEARSSKGNAREIIYDAVVAEVVRLLENERLSIGDRLVRPSDIAILVSANWQAADLQQRLRAAGVPGIIANTESVLASREMTELETVMHAVTNSRYHAAVRAALTTELWGMKASDLRGLDDDDQLWSEAVEALEGLRDTWLTRGFTAMAQRLIVRREVRKRLSTLVDGERRLTNLLHCVEILHQAAARDHFAPVGLLNWVRRTRAAGSREREQSELRLESEARAVTISTIHKAKGLQFGIVFCTDLWDSRPSDVKKPLLVHHKDDESRVVFAFGRESREEYLPLAESERLAEELRLAYVALTRAIHRCYVVWGDIGQKTGGSWKSALGYLLRPTGEDARASGLKVGDGNAAIDALAASNPDLLQAVPLELNEGSLPVWQKKAEGSPPELSAAALTRSLVPQFDVWRVTSFSALTRDHGHGAGVPEAETPDHTDPATDLAIVEEIEPSGIFAFARGARPGTCLHEIFEHCDFTKAGEPEMGALVGVTLKRFGLFDTTPHQGELDPRQDIREMVRRVVSAPLPGAGFSLDQVKPDNRINEWNFNLPLSRMSPASLGDIFARHAEGQVATEYAERLRTLSPDQIHGFLTGFVDLVFRHDDRWFIIDWKSNHLGNTPGDYDQDGLWRPMVNHHYVLQYHLYCAALHRFLGVRLNGYEYERHFGGVFYVFLRGVEGTGDNGWYHDRPPVGLVEALAK